MARLLASLGLLVAFLFAARQVSTWPARLRYPGELNFVEGMRLAEMVHLRQGVPIYAPPSPGRFDAAIYGPLYYLLGSRLVDTRQPAYRPFRVLSLIGTVGCAACCGLLALWLGRRCLAAVLASLCFLAYGLVTSHGTSARSDSVALLLGFAGFLIAYRFRERRAILFATPLMVLSFFYKQQFVAGPLAVVLFLLLQRRYRLALAFAGLLSLGGLGLLVFFQFVAFSGQAFLHHFLIYNLLPFSWFQLSLGASFLGLVLAVPLLLGLEFLRVYPNRLLSCYVGCAVVTSLLTVSKVGSDVNYFLEPVLVLSALIAALFARRVAETPRAVELLVLVGTTLFLGQWFAPSAPRPEDFARDQAVQEFLRRNFSPGTPALGYHTGDLLRAGLETPVSDLYQYSWLTRTGRLSDQDLLNQLNTRRLGVVLVTFDLASPEETNWTNDYLTEGLRRAIVRNYRLMASLDMPRPERFRDDDRFYVWVPRSAREPEGARAALERNAVLAHAE